MQYKAGESTESLGLTGKEQFRYVLPYCVVLFSIFSIEVPTDLKPGQLLTVRVSTGKAFEVVCRFDTEVELTYYRHGGILQYMIRKLIQE